MNVWSARTGNGLDVAFEAFSSSIDEDAAFLEHDVVGSLAHVRGLRHVGLLDDGESAQLIGALQALLQEAHHGVFQLDPALEDVHMNLEAAVTARLGDTGRKLHTGRSRNDQVATCIVLYAREQLTSISQACIALSQTLAAQAEAHGHTPWVAQTHGQPAQPATLGFLLAAHAWRFSQVALQAIWAGKHIAIAPLGSGAVAGSTLPLDPVYTAGLLGLKPPQNALLATGSRDVALTTLQTTTMLGHALSGLAEELFAFTQNGVLHMPPGLTTGSSLMPQKRNPDALELVRGRSRALVGYEAAVQAVTMPLGLGYVRDLQVVKPPLVNACTDALASLQILQACIEGAEFQVGPPAPTPGIGATDAAEALVAHGVPFRTAYTVVAAAHQEGVNPAMHLEQSGLENVAIAAAVAALPGDVSARDTLGGPAPVAVAESLKALHDRLAECEVEVRDSVAACSQATALLGAT